MFYIEKFSRNQFTKNQQNLIRKTNFALVGLGGTGGFIFENLLRLGAENFILFDHDSFELSNFNRQVLATDDTLDKAKIDVACAHAKLINKNVKIKKFHKFGHTSSLIHADIVLDGADNIVTKTTLARIARKSKIPYIFCSANSSRGIVTIFTNYKFETAFQVKECDCCEQQYQHNSKPKTCSSILCPAAALAGTLAASQAICYLLKKPYVKAPDALFFDLFEKNIFWRKKLG